MWLKSERVPGFLFWYLGFALFLIVADRFGRARERRLMMTNRSGGNAADLASIITTPFLIVHSTDS